MIYRQLVAALALSILVLFLAASSGAQEVSLAEMIARNNTGLARLSLGMTKQQVLDEMGSYSAKVRDGILTNPWRVEAFMRKDSSYEILYFVVQKHRAFRPIRQDQATPVVFKDGVLVGWGRNALP